LLPHVLWDLIAVAFAVYPMQPTCPDTEARKRREASLRSQDEAIAEHLEQALRSGELRSAPSFGKPLAEPEGWWGK